MNIASPRSLSELWTAFEKMPEASLLAGGTDLLVKMRAELCAPSSILLLERVPELKGLAEVDDSIRIGACSTHTQILESDLVRTHLPILARAVRCLGSPPVRNMGTIGGNICTASPAGDTLPPLYALGAEIEVLSSTEKRRVPIADFILGPGQIALRPREVVSAIWIKKPANSNVHHYEKVGLRNALACSIAGMAALLGVGADGHVTSAAFAWGSIAPTVLVCPEADKALLGEKISLARLREIAEIVRRAASPISDIRADAEYRRTVAANLVLRLAGIGEK